MTHSVCRKDRWYRVRFAFLFLVIPLVSACSVGQVVVRGSQPVVEGGFAAMNRETDLQLAAAAMPSNLILIEGMLDQDPTNSAMHIYAAQGYYGYAYGFVEWDDPQRASMLYQRCLNHAQQSLALSHPKLDMNSTSLRELRTALQKVGKKDIAALFWSASCWAKWIDMNRDDPRGLSQVARAAAVMERVMALDENYYYGGPHLFFGVYYGNRAPMLGGNYALSEQHFAKARAVNDGKLLIVDVLYAEFLARQKQDRDSFRARLTSANEADPRLLPDMALANVIAQERARRLLELEDTWF